MKHLKIVAYILFISAITSCIDTLMGGEGKLDEDIYLNYQTVTNLELPFEDEWFIAWGGKSLLQNKHFNSRSERYAYDILIVLDTVLANGEVRRKNYSGDWRRNENHYCFGKRLNAPGDGKIIEIVNTIEDNQPGNINNDQPGGNYIIIDHLNGEASVMAHLKKGSIIVAVGDTVVKGEEVGKVGNSGSSTAPHLHYHLRGTVGSSKDIGLPAQFLNYYEDDVFIERGEPVRGQEVRNN
jgi:hypothetical protein